MGDQRPPGLDGVLGGQGPPGTVVDGDQNGAVPVGPRGRGLALLLTRGLPAWLAALTALGPSRPRRPLDETPAELRPRLLPSARTELTTVLAGMVLACTPETEGP